MEEIELIKDIIASPNADTIGNKLMNAKVELNVTRNFLNDASNCTNNYDISLYYKMILGKHIEYLQYKIELLERMHSKLQNNRYTNTKQDDLLEELITVPKKIPKKPDTKKEVSCSIPYTSSDNVDMLI
jgi:hypothetical protein